MQGGNLLIHGQVIPGSSSADDEELIILNGGKAVIDFNFGGIFLVEEAVRDFPNLREEAVVVIDFNLVGFLN